MGWTSTNPVTVGDDTKKSHWDTLWDNCAFCYVPPATVEFFGQSSTPTGWTKKTDWTDNSTLTYVTGSIGSGGSDNPTSWTTAISIQNESSHIHSLQGHDHDLTTGNLFNENGTYSENSGGPSTANTSGGTSHNHGVNQDTFNPRYIKIIAATKDSGDWVTSNPVTSIGNATKHNAHWIVLWANLEYLYLSAITIQFFGQSSAPTGWTKKTDWTDNSMLVYTTGTISSGGSDSPISWTTAISIQNESAHTHPMPHTHTFGAGPHTASGSGYFLTTGNPSPANTGTGSAHNHGVNQDTFSSKYQKIIAATKDSGDWTDTNPASLQDPTKKDHYDTAWDNIVFNYLAAGTIKPFGQSSAPTGWTKKTDWTDNSMLVYTTGTISSGGSDSPISWTTAISIVNESNHIHNMAHTHVLGSGTGFGVIIPPFYYNTTTSGSSVSNTGTGSAHNHGVNQDTMVLKYQSTIMATKNAYVDLNLFETDNIAISEDTLINIS